MPRTSRQPLARYKPLRISTLEPGCPDPPRLKPEHPPATRKIDWNPLKPRGSMDRLSPRSPERGPVEANLKARLQGFDQAISALSRARPR